MALQSQLFRGDLKLEASAVSDPAHIVPGAAGPHVHKLHLALIKLDGAGIAGDEVRRSAYGGSTAQAVLTYKRKRKIVNPSYQKQADNIVGKMTIASLDGEMLKLESNPRNARIEPLFPPPRPVFLAPALAPRRSGLLLAFSFGPGAPPPPQILPGGPAQQMDLLVNETGIFQVVDGAGETVSCDDDSIATVFDPAEPAVQGAIFVTKNPHICSVRGKKAGRTTISVTRSNALGIPIGVVRFPLVVEAAPSSGQFVSLRGTPVNPKKTGRMINIFGESTDKTAGFDNFTTDPKFSVGNDGVARPFTNDPSKPPGIANRTASDICLRDAPINQVSIDEIRRIAMPSCRLTIALNSAGPVKDAIPGGTDQQLKRVRDAFIPPGQPALQEGPHNEVDSQGRPTVRKVLVLDIP